MPHYLLVAQETDDSDIICRDVIEAESYEAARARVGKMLADYELGDMDRFTIGNLVEVVPHETRGIYGPDIDLAALAGDSGQSLADWKYEVANGDTLLGFADWVAHQREIVDEDADRYDHDPEDPECDCIGCVKDRM